MNIDPFGEENWEEVDYKCNHKMVMKIRVVDGKNPQTYIKCLFCNKEEKL
jgi:hypothetical protein